MKIHLSLEQQLMVEKNQNLVHYLVKKLSVPFDEYEDTFQIGVIGLMKAIASFDITKKIKFATYASRCITNEIFMSFRKKKSDSNNIYLDSELSKDKEGNALLLSDIIVDTSVKDVQEEMINNESICEYIEVVLNCLSIRDKMVLLYKIAGISQWCIAEMFDLCQSYVSRLTLKGQNKVRKILDVNRKYKKVFTIKLIDEKFKIEFLLNNVKQEFESFSLDIKESLKYSNYKINFVNERVEIYLPAEVESFVFIAEIIKQIEISKMKYAGLKPDSATEEAFYKNDIFEIIKKQYRQEKNIKSAKIDVDLLNSNNPNNNQIREYIHKLNSFTSKELKDHFSTFSPKTVNWVIQNEKKKGKIINTGRAQYSVVSVKNSIVD